MKDDEHAWKHYLSSGPDRREQKSSPSTNPCWAAGRMHTPFLRKAWHHQALLQIHEDLCSLHSCAICSLLRQMEKK